MPRTLDRKRLRDALARATEELLAARTAQGHWTGELSSSPLSTATAVTALSVVQRTSPHADFHGETSRGLEWLARSVNPDGGWGDTTLSLSNLSTTALCWAAFGAVPGADAKYRALLQQTEAWLTLQAGGIEPDQLAPAIIRRYGKDRTFSVPILTHCALAGRLGSGSEAWRWVLPLPFELAACPHQWFAALRFPVVSYALPALIAIGQARHYHRPSRNPAARLARNLARQRTLRVLEQIQPPNGGFLEATPLTSFVVMSLAGSGQTQHLVTERGVQFLVRSQRQDGSWPIDTNLATWLTTLSVNALSQPCVPKLLVGPEPAGRFPLAPSDGERVGERGSLGELTALLSPSLSSLGGRRGRNHPQLRDAPLSQGGSTEKLPAAEAASIRAWLLGQQYRHEHPYTHSPPGGWAWTDLPGGVPDADDTAGALLALRDLGQVDEETRRAALSGIQWLLGLQNRDGGIPTFCRGWGTLPFDRSSADITAHAVRAWMAWFDEVPKGGQRRVLTGLERALDFLFRVQRPDGSWTPLWFGNQFATGDENPCYGTARVVRALAEAVSFAARNAAGTSAHPRASVGRSGLSAAQSEAAVSHLAKGVRWLVSTQRADGSWGGTLAGPASVEETALATEALGFALGTGFGEAAAREELEGAVLRSAEWLMAHVESGAWTETAPIGFYFAKLWYYERLYPMIFTVGALGRAETALGL